VVRFEAFELDLRARELRKDGRSTGLREQSIRILALLLEKPGEVVLREEIRKTLWPNDTLVEFDQSINAAIKRLRQALDDSADQPKYIETLARRGYRWLVPVQVGEGALAARELSLVPLPEIQSIAGNLIGKKVSHYRVLEVLGGGGMGVVYKAEDIKLGRRVALKFLPEEVASEPSALERFEREARAASALDHPNICAIHEFGEHDGLPFIVMPLLEGQTLRERISAQPRQPGKPLPTAELLDFAAQITRGLEAAHQNGIIHRDIKPANIFITNRGEAKILDFGVAKLIHRDMEFGVALAESENTTPERVHASSSLNLTRTGTTVGTASYMSPEQILGEKLDVRTDLFSFGLVLHEMATGHQAFAGDTVEIIRDEILYRPVEPARQLNPELPSKFEEVLTKALAKDRNDRYQHASALRADLEGMQQDLTPRAQAPWRETAAAVILVALVVSAIFWLVQRQPSPSSVVSELKVRQLTNNSADNAVGSGAISRDGKYVAYTDAKGIRIQLVGTGESHVIPQPEGLKPDEVGWDIAGWSPDSTRLLVNAHPPGQDAEKVNSKGSSIWVVSVLGGEPRKLRDNATAGEPSPDGALVPFTTNKGRIGDREIWVMEANGEHARKLYDTGEGNSVGFVVWSPEENESSTRSSTILVAQPWLNAT
jgi:eukaryotic-like serine/threonine-protein kinase